jgi:hypothetical protein
MTLGSDARLMAILLGMTSALLLSACNIVGANGFFPNIGAFNSNTNGERIYFAARNEAGDRIRYTGGPPFSGMMMTNSLACADCHGADGRGGIHTMHMQVMEAPDIRWSTLSSGEHGGHGNDIEGEHVEAAYDQEKFFRAVRKGFEPGGHTLSRNMPRWRMSDQDLEDLLHFLGTLP